MQVLTIASPAAMSPSARIVEEEVKREEGAHVNRSQSVVDSRRRGEKDNLCQQLTIENEVVAATLLLDGSGSSSLPVICQMSIKLALCWCFCQ